MNTGHKSWQEIIALQEIIQHIQKCFTKAAGAEPGDIGALVSLHIDLLATSEVAAKQEPGSSAASAELLENVERIAGMVESIVLNEAGASAIHEVAKQIDEIQHLLSGRPEIPATATSPIPPPPPKAKPAAAKIPPRPALPTIGDERVITDKDREMAFEFVGEATGHLESAEASLLRLEEDPTDIDQVNSVFRAFHTLKGVAGFLELKQIGALAHVAETLLDLARKGKIQLRDSVLDVVLEAQAVMGNMVTAVDVAAKTETAPAIQSGLSNLIQRLDAAARGESTAAPSLATAQQESDRPAATETTPATAVTPAVAAPGTASSNANNPTNEGFVKVSTTRLDALINAVGELVISQSMVTQDLGAVALIGDQRLTRNLSHLGKITRGLQELSMSMRMVPIAAVFQKMARLARDTSRKAGKEIEFIQVGGETELDRNVVEAISDPLVHMVRNSVDHGLEGPEDREKAGKPRLGKVILKAFHQSGNVVVEITDDGRGLNKERIVQKAIAAGIVKEGQDLTDQQIFHLIFHPGLSTAEKITDISGRGVGMDVVRKNVEALRGRIEIASTPGKGSTFTVRLPLTLAVIDGLVVRVGDQRFIIPITSIEQSLRPTQAQLSTVQGKGELCMVRNRLLPIVRLHKLFHVEPKTADPTQSLVVIVQEGSSNCCLLVDEVVGQQQVVIKSVGKEIGTLPGIAGCAILGDGNVSLILDVAGILQSALNERNEL
jgi:two-component system chemotaxis sensor kinase CheA